MERQKSFPDPKRELRARHLKLREQMTEAQAKEKSRRLCGRILRSEWYRECEALYLYYPLGKEADCRPVAEQALNDGKLVALPRTWDGGRMEFYRMESLGQVEEGAFHVMEPISECPLVQRKRAAALVPGVVFDAAGNRYGYGKGYYDRYFSRFPDLLRIGAAYENQMEKELPVLGTDVRMNMIYTERGFYRCDEAGMKERIGL